MPNAVCGCHGTATVNIGSTASSPGRSRMGRREPGGIQGDHGFTRSPISLRAQDLAGRLRLSGEAPVPRSMTTCSVDVMAPSGPKTASEGFQSRRTSLVPPGAVSSARARPRSCPASRRAGTIWTTRTRYRPRGGRPCTSTSDASMIVSDRHGKRRRAELHHGLRAGNAQRRCRKSSPSTSLPRTSLCRSRHILGVNSTIHRVRRRTSRSKRGTSSCLSRRPGKLSYLAGRPLSNTKVKHYYEKKTVTRGVHASGRFRYLAQLL